MTPAEHLLLACCLPERPSEWRSHTLRRLIDAGVDWDAVVEISRPAVLAPLLHARLAGVPGVPERTRHTLAGLYRLNAARNAWILAEVERLAGALRERRVAAVLLKGVALAAAVYRDPGLRVMEDIDLLVRSADLAAARAVMVSLGYRAVHHDPPPNHHLVPFLTPQRFPVEVHWQLIAEPHPFRIDPALVWRERVTARLGGTPVHIPAPTLLAWHVAVHEAFQHGFARLLRSLADLDALAARYGGRLDWHLLRSLAGATGTRHHVDSMLYFAGALLGGPWRGRVARPPRRLARLVARGPPARPAAAWAALRSGLLPELPVCPHNPFSGGDLERVWRLAGLLRDPD